MVIMSKNLRVFHQKLYIWSASKVGRQGVLMRIICCIDLLYRVFPNKRPKVG